MASDTSEEWRDRVLRAVTDVQDSYIAGRTPGQVFEELLRHVLEITDSEYGYIGEVLEDDGTPYLKAYAMTNIAWDEASRKIYEQAMEGGGFEFRNLQSLFGVVLTSGEPVIANDAPNDPRAAGTMRGHLPLERFLGLPLYSEGQLVGSVGVSNREGGYDQALVDSLHPFLATCGNLVRAFREHRLREEAEVEAQAAQAHLTAVVEAASEGILTVDATGVVVAANSSARRLLGSDPLGRPLVEFAVAADRELAERSLAERDGSSIRLRFIGDAGGELVTDTTFSRADTGHGPVVVVVMRDATAAFAAEQALREARDEANRLNQAKNDFLATMSHELRTPLNGVIGLTDLLKMGVGGDLSEQQDEFVGLIEKSGQHLLALINDVLDLAKVEADKVELEHEPVDVGAMLREVAEVVEATPSADGRRISLDVDETVPEVEADPRRLRQILLNLVVNACKFTAAPGAVGVRVRPPASTPGRLVIDVWDEGQGIAEEDQVRLFRPFEQLDTSLTRQHGGTGLGLALSRRLARAHGGDITVESEVEKGSTFTLTLPVGGVDLTPRRRATDV